MASLREQVLARVAVVLANATPAGANVSRSREIAIHRGVSPHVCVLSRGTPTVERYGTSTDKHRIEFDLAIFVRGDPWDTLADEIDVPAHAAVMADATLREWGVELFRLGDDVDSEEADRTAGCLNVHYAATFFTRAGDIAARP